MVATSGVLFARQPIFNRKREHAGFELLFRSSEENAFSGTLDGNKATNEVLLNAFIESDALETCGSLPAFINMTRDLLRQPLPFSTEQIVLEVLETVDWDDQLEADIQNLKKLGYRIALDDFAPEHIDSPLVSMADIIKIEYPTWPQQDLPALVQKLKQSPRQILAEKIETHDAFQFCLDAGFDLFQGFFLARPEMRHGQKMPNNKLAVMHLLAAVHKPDATLDELARIIRYDPFMSMRFLKLINTSNWRRPARITSIQTAVRLLGLNRVRMMANMLALSKMDDKPHALHNMALVRAYFAERIGRYIGVDDAASCFTVGIFSCLDAFFDQPLAHIIEQLPLHHDLQQALLQHGGLMGLILHTVTNYQQANWEHIAWEELSHFAIDRDVLATSYMNSLKDAAIAWPL